jgi:hypothetical protein
MTQCRLSKVAHAKNGAGNGSQMQRAIIHAEGVCWLSGGGDIIHAAGVRVAFLSSTPKARIVNWQEKLGGPTVFTRGVRAFGADIGSRSD